MTKGRDKADRAAKINVPEEAIEAGARAFLKTTGLFEIGQTMACVYAEDIIRAALPLLSGKRKSILRARARSQDEI